MTNARREEKNEDAKFDDADSIGIKLMLLLLPLELAAAPLDARRARAASAEALESQRLDIDVRGKARSAEEERALLFRFFFLPLSQSKKWLALSPHFLDRSIQFCKKQKASAPILYYARFDGGNATPPGGDATSSISWTPASS